MSIVHHVDLHGKYDGYASLGIPILASQNEQFKSHVMRSHSLLLTLHVYQAFNRTQVPSQSDAGPVPAPVRASPNV